MESLNTARLNKSKRKPPINNNSTPKFWLLCSRRCSHHCLHEAGSQYVNTFFSHQAGSRDKAGSYRRGLASGKFPIGCFRALILVELKAEIMSALSAYRYSSSVLNAQLSRRESDTAENIGSRVQACMIGLPLIGNRCTRQLASGFWILEIRLEKNRSDWLDVRSEGGRGGRLRQTQRYRFSCC